MKEDRHRTALVWALSRASTEDPKKLKLMGEVLDRYDELIELEQQLQATKAESAPTESPAGP